MTYLSRPSTLARCALIGLVAGCSSSTANNGPAPAPMVTSEDIARNPGESIERTIQAKSSGVLITRCPDGSIALQIRGTSSWDASSRPLYVIDGSPMEPGAGGVLSGVNPYDIESIRVLKDPADIAVYGMRGANGVILVTTKRPGKR
ncbi:MAG: TonB-dependent receptor plug domain-containing protein [Gemmatimonadota bacterium]|nr:TonB-dependent receptor plug domain-containing protein [Gemmatimonadota bacterium]